VCLFDVEHTALTAKRSILIKPERSKVSPFCTQLTTLTQEQVDTGMAFAAACAILENDYSTAGRIWASWGNYDRRMFQEQCEHFDVHYPFTVRHINLKKLFAKLNGRQNYGMAGALAKAELPLEGTHHRGADDAWNIARLLGYMVSRHGPKILK
jgi:inhibitor of KinA sporulation pathway (predicted exonuclease)